jgi:elongin-A
MDKGPLSLKELALRVCEKRHGDIQSVGDVSFHLIESVLRKCSPEQLIAIEKSSPRLRGETNGIWKEHLERKFPSVAYKYSDLQDAHYRRVYRKELKKEAIHLEEASARLRTKYAKLEDDKMKRSIVKLDHDPRRKKIAKKEKSKY